MSTTEPSRALVGTIVHHAIAPTACSATDITSARRIDVFWITGGCTILDGRPPPQ
jgi:hypothetical protein